MLIRTTKPARAHDPNQLAEDEASENGDENRSPEVLPSRSFAAAHSGLERNVWFNIRISRISLTNIWGRAL